MSARRNAISDGARRANDETQGKLPRDPLRLAMAALVFLTISRAHQHYAALGAVRPAMILFVLAAGYAVLNRDALASERLMKYWPPKVVVALGILACISIPFALSMGQAGRFVLQSYSKVILTALLLVASIRGPRDLRLYVWAYVLACGFLVWLSIFAFDVSQTGNMFRLGNLYMYDANDMGLVLSVGLPLAVLLVQTSKGLPRILSLIILLGIGASLARSGSRGGFLGLLAVTVVLLVFLRQISVFKRVAFVGVVALGLVFMAPQGYWGQMQSLTEPTKGYNWQSDYGRKAVAERGLGYMLRYPLFGVGPGNFGRAEGTLSKVARKRQMEGRGFKWIAPHNSFVEAGAEMGIPGLVLWSSLVFGIIVGMVRLRRRLPDEWARGDPDRKFVHGLTLYLPVSMVGFAVSGFFVSFAYMDHIYLLAAFATGIYASADSLTSKRDVARGRKVPVRLLRPESRDRADSEGASRPKF